MIKQEIFYFGLTQAELQTLRCRFPFGFQFFEIKAEDFDDYEKVKFIVTKSCCTFINPRKITHEQLDALIFEHRISTNTCHATMLLFTKPFKNEQKKYIDTEDLHVVDLLTRFDRPVRDVVDVIKKAMLPCWDGLDKMLCNGFNDGWYLVDIETTGIDPTIDEIISISIAYMAAYEIKSCKTLYIRQKDLISEDVAEITGITNEMLENGVSREEAVEFLENLHFNAPVIVESYNYYIPFLQELYHLCGKKFDIPHLEIEGLASIVFSYMVERCSMNIIPHLTQRKYPRTPIEHPNIAKLYDLTLAVFENLQDRYGVRAPLQFHSLYDGEILCGN